MNHIVIKRQLFADSIKRRLLFSVSSCCFFIKWLSSRNNTADWYCREQPNAWSLWTGKHSPILLVFESPINQMAHLQFYENCKLSQAGKELGKKKKKMGRTDCSILMKGSFANVIFPPIHHEFFFPQIFSCSALISVTPCFHSPKAKVYGPLRNKCKEHHVMMPALSRGHS